MSYVWNNDSRLSAYFQVNGGPSAGKKRMGTGKIRVQYIAFRSLHYVAFCRGRSGILLICAALSSAGSGSNDHHINTINGGHLAFLCLSMATPGEVYCTVSAYSSNCK